MSDNAGAIDPETGNAGNAHTGKPYEIAPEGAHNRLDKTDEQSIANKLKDAELVEKKEKAADEAKAHADPTALARSHGNCWEPSRGAKKDKELLDDEEEIIRKMDEAKEQSAKAHKH
ncbi:hypothetical protein P7C73_g4365, partial [Tremellales sp. Uapishka_1]